MGSYSFNTLAKGQVLVEYTLHRSQIQFSTRYKGLILVQYILQSAHIG